MPRIPSAADVNPVGAAVSRLPTVRAEAEDFGVDVVTSLTEFGQAAVYAFRETKRRELLKKKKEKREASEKQVAAAKAVVTQRAESNTLINDMKGGDASTGLTAEEAIKQFDRSVEENLGTLPAPQREAVKAAITPVREGHQVRALQSDNNIRVQKLIQETDGVLGSLENLALQEPQSAEHYVMEGTALLQGLLESGALTAEQFAGQSAAFRRSLYTKVVRSQPAADALADLEEGVYDQALGDPELKQFLQTETAWRLQSETAQGAAGAEGQMARLRRGEAVPGELTAATQRILQAGDMADAALQNERALRVRSELQKLRYAPEAEVAAGIAALAPTADAVDAAERQKVQQEVWNQSQIMLRERRADPAAYVMGLPAVAAAFAAAEKHPALLPDAVAGRLAAQAALGLTPEGQNVLTKEERAQIWSGLMRLAPEQRIAALMELGNLYGDQSGAVATDLAEAGLSVNELLAGDPSGGPEVAGQLVQAAESRGEAKAPETGVIQEAAEKLIVEGKEAGNQRGNQELPEDMEFSLPSSRPKPNPLREDESIEGRLHIPKLVGTPEEQARQLIDATGLEFDVPEGLFRYYGQPDFLPLLRDFLNVREIFELHGQHGVNGLVERASAIRESIGAPAMGNTLDQQIWTLADLVLDKPYIYPWSLTNIELTSSIGALAERLRDSANQSVGFELFSTIAELFVPVGKIKQGIGVALNAVGLSDSIDTATSHKEFWHLVNEAIRRKILIVNPEAAKGAGL
ncbi:MAG: hypothetical protein ACFB13_12600 [Kiloniellaceae bacterium]